ncbi:hypothetical protein D3C81_2026940 [compost metagenome]
MLEPEQVIDHAGQAESGTSALAALIQHQPLGDVTLEVFRQVSLCRRTRRQRAQRWQVRQVAKVQAIGAGVEQPACDRSAVDGGLGFGELDGAGFGFAHALLLEEAFDG